MHGHETGYLDSSYINGAGQFWAVAVHAKVEGIGVESDWRCPVGNIDPRVGGASGSQHVLGKAGDFYADDWGDSVYDLMEGAARAAGAGYWYRDVAHIHVDWR